MMFLLFAALIGTSPLALYPPPTIGMAVQATRQTQGPKFKADSPFEMGTMSAGTKKTFELEYANVGTTPLVIMEVKAQCGCTVAKFSKKPLMPGQKATVTVTYKPGQNRGFNMKTLTLFTNEGSEPRYMSFRVMVD